MLNIRSSVCSSSLVSFFVFHLKFGAVADDTDGTIKKSLWVVVKNKFKKNKIWRINLRVKSAESACVVVFLFSYNPTLKKSKVPKATTLNERWTIDHLRQWTRQKESQTDLRHYKRRKGIIRLDSPLAWFRLMVEINYSSFYSFDRSVGGLSWTLVKYHKTQECFF